MVGGGGTRLRRLASAAVGGVLPVAALLAYTYLTTGSFLHPGYDYQYRLEATGYPTLGYHPAWSVEDPRYVPQNLGIMLGALPEVLPDELPNTLGLAEDVPLCTKPGAQRSLFDVECPLVIPVDIGTSVLLSAPGLLLALFAFRWHGRTRLGIGAAAAVAAHRRRSTSPTSRRAGSSGATGSRWTSCPSSCRWWRWEPRVQPTGARGCSPCCCWWRAAWSTCGA